jgi:hypothetical protein
MSNPATGTMRDMLSAIHSKNAGPFSVTVDLFFKSPEAFRTVIERRLVTPETVSRIYGLGAESVKVIEFEAAHAIKVSMPRVVAGGSPGDRDVAGGQQYAPLIDIAL